MLGVDQWNETWVGTNRIFDRIRPVINESDNNLVYRLNKTEFNDHFRKKNIGSKYLFDVRSEPAVYNIYKGNDDKHAFEFSVEVFGKKYPTIAFLFFLKDDTKYLPISPENFEKCFRQLNIDIKLQGKCSWENYNAFIGIIDCIRELMSAYLPLAHEPTLLEAHSFVWIIGEEYYTNWLQGRKNREIQEKAERLKKQAKEEREKNRIPTKVLSGFSDEDLAEIGPRLEGRIINSTRKGSVEVLKFVPGQPPTMSIIYRDLDSDESVDIELTDAVRRNLYISLELFNEIIGKEIDNKQLQESRNNSKSIVIPEGEEEQIAQAAMMPMEQLKEVATIRERELPERQEVSTTQYKRDHYIAELAKREADGVCQLCGENAPFTDKDGKPYLESHHIIWLSEGGSDTIENTIAVYGNSRGW